MKTILFFVAHRGINRYAYAMLWLAPVLVTPYYITYDLLLLALPISFLFPLLSRDRLMQAAVGLIWIMPLLAIFIYSTQPVTWSALALFTLCAWRFFTTSISQGSSPREVIDSSSSYLEKADGRKILYLAKLVTNSDD